MKNLEQELDFFHFKKSTKSNKKFLFLLMARPLLIITFTAYAALPVILSLGIKEKSFEKVNVQPYNQPSFNTNLYQEWPLMGFRDVAWGSSPKVFKSTMDLNGSFAMKSMGDHNMVDHEGFGFNTPAIENSNCLYSLEEFDVTSKQGLLAVYCYIDNKLVSGSTYTLDGKQQTWGLGVNTKNLQQPLLNNK